MHKVTHQVKYLVDSIHQLAPALEGYHYTFLSANNYKKLLVSDPSEGLKVYWLELLARAHLASSTGILRTSRWLIGVDLACTSHNYPMFCSSYRGLIESCADINYSVGIVPSTLALSLEQIHAAITKKFGNTFYSSPDLEDRLIHFSHARKTHRSEHPPDSHRVKTTKDYLANLETVPDIQGEPVKQIMACYDILCQVGHPSLASVYMFLESAEIPSANTPDLIDVTLELRTDTDHAYIDAVFDEYPDVFADILRTSVTPCLMTMCMLNLLGIDHLRTPLADRWDWSRFPSWAKFTSKLNMLNLQE